MTAGVAICLRAGYFEERGFLSESCGNFDFLAVTLLAFSALTYVQTMLFKLFRGFAMGKQVEFGRKGGRNSQ